MLKFLEMPPQKTNQPKNSKPPRYRTYPPRPPGPPEVVDPVWLLKAITVVIAAALVCGYASLCLLLYQGQWQLILHPRQTVAPPPAIGGTPVDFIRFATDESGIPQLSGWRIPPTPGGRYAALTVLYLPPGDGSLTDSTPTLERLHNLGVNLFAVDYRGYGQSARVHPDQQRMMQDADWSLQYLLNTRAIPEKQIVLYGSGVGASLATHLATLHPAIPAIILDSPGPDPLKTVLDDPRTHFLPVRALLHDRFPLAEPLSTLKTPKLLIQTNPSDSPFTNAADPKITVSEHLQPSSPEYQAAWKIAVTRFLDQYTNTQPIQLTLPGKGLSQ